MNIETRLLRKLRFVNRFHTEPTIKEQNVAEHTFNMMVILDAIGRPDLLVHALYHDMLEAITGDLPAPFKRQFNGNTDGTLHKYENQLRNEYHLPDEPSEHDKYVLKSADMLELVLTCREELAMGNRLIGGVLDRASLYFNGTIAKLSTEDQDRIRLQEIFDG